MRPLRTTLAMTLLTVLCVCPAFGGGPAPAGAVNLLGLKLDDQPIMVSVPVSKDSSLVIDLPEHYWVHCLPHAGRPAALDGDGAILQYCPLVDSVGFTSLVYVGVIPLPEVKGGELLTDRVLRGETAFVADLRAKYARNNITLLTDVEKIKLIKSPLKLGGKGTAAARTSVYNTKLVGEVTNRPAEMYTGECVFLNVPGTETLVYIAVDTSKGGTSLEKVVLNLSIGKTGAATKASSVRKLLDSSQPVANAYPYRHLWFECPPGFVPNWPARDVDRISWAEDRRDAMGGEVGASLRLDTRLPGQVSTIEEEAEIQRKLYSVDDAVKPRRVDLATKGVYAVLYAYKTKLDDKDCGASTAVFRFDDEIWILSWYTFGDDARIKLDQLVFDKLLGSMHLARR